MNEYIVISDEVGIVATFRQRKGEQLTPSRAYLNLVRVYPLEAPHLHKIYGPIEPPKGGKRVEVFLSQGPDGNGRIAGNWYDFIVFTLEQWSNAAQSK